LLCAIYIAPFALCRLHCAVCIALNTESQLKLFADDTNLFIFGKSFLEDSIKTNKLLNNLNKWFVGNKLSLNIQKTCYSAFSSGQAYNDYDLNSLNINGITIKRCDSVKYFGVWIDDKVKLEETH